MLQEVRAVLHGARRNPGPSMVAVVCLALGIGVNLSLIGLIDALTFRAPAGVDDPTSLVRVRVGVEVGPVGQGAGPALSYPTYTRVAAERLDLFDGLAAYGGGAGTLGGGATARPASFLTVTDNYFTVLGVQPRLGRFFGSDGAGAEEATQVVVSYRFWRQSLGANPDALGHVLRLNGVPLTVIGVAPDGFVGVDLGDPDFWVRAELRRLPEFGQVELSGSTGLHWLQLVGRLRPGLSFESAAAATHVPPGEMFEARPVSGAGPSMLPLSLLPLRAMFFADQRGQNPVPLWSLAISAAVLLLACATVANLLLVQAVRRRRETAVRLAMGASPGRILRGQAIEGVGLATIALVLATMIAGASLGLLRRLPIPPVADVLTARVVVLGLGLTLLTPLVFGAVPALWTLRRDVSDLLADAGAAGSSSASRLQRGSMVAQTAIGFALLVSAGLFLRSLDNAQHVDVGMDLDRVLVASLDRGPMMRASLPPDLIEEALTRARRTPGVQAADVSNLIPFYLFSRASFEVADGGDRGETSPRALINVVGPDYLSVVGIDMAYGRPIDDSHGPGTAPVALVSESLALRHWPGSTPIGACLRLGGSYGNGCVEVIGVARDTRLEDLTGSSSEVLYLANGQLPPDERSSRIFIRTADDRPEVAPALQAELQSLEADMPYVEVARLDERLRPQLLQWEVASGLFVVLGALAALLGAVGVYSVVTFRASQRNRELGIKRALGAGRLTLLTAELRSAGMLSLAGIGCGIVLGALAGRLYQDQLFGLRVVEPFVHMGVGGLLLGVALFAALRPAWHATGADPAAALRREQPPKRHGDSPP